MGGRRRLTAGQPRMLGRHDAAEGARFRRAWRALIGEFGQPEPDSLLALEMGRTAVAHANLVAATEALSLARRTRATGKGRRPGGKAIERLNRRVGLCDRSYREALDHLRVMVAKNGHPPTMAEAIRQKAGP